MLLQDGLVAAFASASQTRAWRIGLFNTAAMLDLVEVASIQQGRDNQLARYNDYRELMQYPRVTRFEQITAILVVSELRRIYSDVDKIEFFVGLFERLYRRDRRAPLIGRMVAADAFSHALTNRCFRHMFFTPGRSRQPVWRQSAKPARSPISGRNDVVH